jgi:hypothetical protein
VEVLKRGGLHCRWVTTWTRQEPEEEESDAVDLLHRLVGNLGQGASGRGLSSALIYRVRRMLGQLGEWPEWAPGSWGTLPPGIDLHSFLRAEILRTLSDNPDREAQQTADGLAHLVSRLLGPSRNQPNGANANITHAGVDALLLARFIAGGGQEEEA